MIYGIGRKAVEKTEIRKEEEGRMGGEGNIGVCGGRHHTSHV